MIRIFRKFILVVCCSFCMISVANALETKAKYVAIMDYDTGEYLYVKDHQKMIPPASMSKIMTVYILLDKIKEGELSLEDEFVVSENAWRKGGAATGGSTMFLNVKEEVSVENLLKGIVIQSGNDACIVVAENISGSEENFAKLMNEVADEMGMKNSSFVNSTGLPDPKHRVSSEDLAILSRNLIKNFSDFYYLFAQKEFTHNGIKQGNRNPLLYNMQGADGIKTGHTVEAGYCLATSVKKNDRRLIAVISGLESVKERSEESQKLMSWAFREFDNYKILKIGQKIKDVEVFLGKNESKVSLVAGEDLILTVRKSDFRKIKLTVEYKTPLKAPIIKGQEYGILKIEIPEKDVLEVPLVAERSIEKKSWLGRVFANIQYMFLGLF